MKIILASASKRRQELLKKAGHKFAVMASQVKEAPFFQKYPDPKIAVKKLALVKARDVQRKIEATSYKLKAKSYLIVAADTVIVFNTTVMGKPKNRQEAVRMLRRLRGQKHQVITGLALIDHTGRKKTVGETTDVWFGCFSDLAMEKYLDTGVYLDRAGAYGIQDSKCNFVARFEGSYTNILGLPMEKLNLLL